MSFNERGHPNNDERLHNAIGSSLSSSSSSSRWIPPTNAPHHHHHQHITATAAAPAFQKNIDSDRSMQYNDRENNYRRIEGGLSGRGSGGRQGGGKLMRQHRHSSNDTYNQRNLHRRPMPPQHKNIITPTDTTKPSFSASQSVFTTPCPTTATGPTATNNNNNTNDDTRKLNPTDPTEARRINQRLRQVLFGKNTVGYEEYIKRVPKHKRKHRSLECPMTPDHRADIPTKRWQGLLNAWRRALHQYDPADQLRQQPSSASITLVPRPCSTEEDVQAEEIAQAKASGLQVAFGSMNVGQEARLFSMKVAPDDDNDNELMMMMKNSVASGASGVKDNNDNGQVETTTNDMKHFDEEAAYQRAMMIGGGGGGGGDAYANFLEECESDSDDDIL